MKLILSSFLILISAFAIAADTLVILDNGHITRNGADLNSAASALLNGTVTAAEFEGALKAKLDAAKAAKIEAEADLAALKERISTVLQTILTEELKTGEGPKTALLRKLIAESQKSEQELKREALAAEIAAKQAELQKLAE